MAAAHVDRCPYCDGVLEQSVMNPAMFRCRECRRWFQHVKRGAKCGLFGWVDRYPRPLKFTPCETQGSLAL